MHEKQKSQKEIEWKIYWAYIGIINNNSTKALRLTSPCPISNNCYRGRQWKQPLWMGMGIMSVMNPEQMHAANKILKC